MSILQWINYSHPNKVMYRKTIKKWLTKLIYGSDIILKTGLVVAPVAHDISMILVNQMTSLVVTLGMYTAKKTVYNGVILIGGLLGLLF